jgi:hypothetical protein
MRSIRIVIAIALCLLLGQQVTLAQSTGRGAPRALPQRLDVGFTLTPTQNIWTFLLLDSRTGRLWQIQYGVSDTAFAGRLPINEETLAPADSAHVGRFSLHETQNMFNFLLLDHDDGRVWQVQWSTTEEARGIVRVLSTPIP